MPIEFRCTGCTKLLRTPDESAGKKARCPDCGTIVDVPAASVPPPPSTPPSTPPSSPGGFTPSGPFGGSNAGGPTSPPPSQPFGGNVFSDGSSPGGGFGGGAGIGGGGGFGPAPMGNNPYAAPHLAPQTPWGSVAAGPLSHQTVTLDQLFSTTWEIFKPQWGMGLVLALIMFGLNIGASFITTPINFGAQATNEISLIVAGQIASQIITMFVQTYAQIGANLVALHWARTGTVDVGRFFQATPYFLRGLGITFLTQLIVFGIALVCMIPLFVLLAMKAKEEVAVIAGISGALVAAPLMGWIGMRLLLSSMFLVDRNTGVVESMKLSDQFMVNNKLNMFLALIVLGFGAMIIGICTCFLGFLAAPAFMALFTSVAYLLITGQALLVPSRQNFR